MKIAVLSDIHSNKYALSSTLKFLEDKGIESYIFLGDYFGYYPWVAETFGLIEKIFSKSFFILGNHDELMCRDEAPKPTPEYWDVIVQNKAELTPAVIDWLKSLFPEKKIQIGGLQFNLYHGTPAEPLTGRFYPDNKNEYDWFPKKNEVLLMGHTHYPLSRKLKDGGLMINPGSIGQPRDGTLESSLCIINTETVEVKFHRVPYLIDKAIAELEKMNWYPRAIHSLKKISKSQNDR
jgi:putative phosphoesterase